MCPSHVPRAIANLEDHPQPAGLTPAQRDSFQFLSERANFLYKLIYSNLWLAEPAVVNALSGDKVTNFSTSTTD